MKKDAAIGLYIIVGAVTLYFIGLIYFSISDRLPVSLNRAETNRYSSAISGYLLPESSKVVYSTMYWGRGSEPLSICTVFSLSENDFSNMKKYEFSQRSPYQKNSISSIDRECAEFLAQTKDESAKLFVEYRQQGDRLRGYTVYTNELDRLVMLEMYLYD